jgi:hypothetical protein
LQVAFTFVWVNVVEKLQSSMELLAITRAKSKEPKPKDDNLIYGLEKRPNNNASIFRLKIWSTTNYKLLFYNNGKCFILGNLCNW